MVESGILLGIGFYDHTIMKLTNELADKVILEELGRRLAQMRSARSMTHDALSQKAGIPKGVLERLENGSLTSSLSIFVRVFRVLDEIHRFENLLPESMVKRTESARSCSKFVVSK